MRLVSPLPLPLMQLNSVHAASRSLLLFMIRGRLCASLAATVAIMLLCHIMLLTAFVDRQIMANNHFYRDNGANADQDVAVVIGGAPDGGGRVLYYEDGYNVQKGSDRLGSMTDEREDIVDLQFSDQADVMNQKVAEHEDIVDVSDITSNRETHHGNKHLLAEYSYDKEQVEKDIPNKVKVSKDITKFDVKASKILGAIKPPIPPMPKHEVETFIINVQTLESLKSVKRKRRSKRSEEKSEDQHSLLGAGLNSDLKTNGYKSSNPSNQNIPSISQDKKQSQKRMHQNQHQFKASAVQEINIDPIKKDEEWEADEDMSLEYLIVAGKSSSRAAGATTTTATTTLKPTTSARYRQNTKRSSAQKTSHATTNNRSSEKKTAAASSTSLDTKKLKYVSSKEKPVQIGSQLALPSLGNAPRLHGKTGYSVTRLKQKQSGRDADRLKQEKIRQSLQSRKKRLLAMQNHFKWKHYVPPVATLQQQEQRKPTQNKS